MPQSSNTLADHLERVAPERPRRLVLLEALRALILWCYEREPHRQHDLALHLVQNELLRRRAGAAPVPVTFPSPPAGAPFTAAQIVELVADWEASSYAASLTLSDGELDPLTTLLVASEVTTYLASADGLPVRLDRLDPLAYREHVEAMDENIGGRPKPVDFTAYLLDSTGELYALAIERGLLDPTIGYTLVAQLRVLADLSEGEPGIAAA